MVVPRLVLFHLKLLHQVFRQHLGRLFQGQRPPPPPARLSRCPGLSAGPSALSQSRPLAGPAAAAQVPPRRPTTATRRRCRSGAARSARRGPASRLAPRCPTTPTASAPARAHQPAFQAGSSRRSRAQRGTSAEPSQTGAAIQTPGGASANRERAAGRAAATSSNRFSPQARGSPGLKGKQPMATPKETKEAGKGEGVRPKAPPPPLL